MKRKPFQKKKKEISEKVHDKDHNSKSSSTIKKEQKGMIIKGELGT